ncbi:MAG TPA: rod shape-determining protein MreC, partial [Gammaproteobacteria bacterium]|nr:rod shape-determining protein MreC [Gammaproteobacteria bacterium]
PVLNPLRNALEIGLTPIHAMVYVPQQAYQLTHSFFLKRHELIYENTQLKTEKMHLLAKIQKLNELEAENIELRDLLLSSAKMSDKTHAARIIGVATDPFSHHILINRGTYKGILTGQVVIDAAGVFGVISSSSTFKSRVLLITDPSLAVPVQNVRNGLRAIASGNGSKVRLDLLYVSTNADIQVGDEFVTSGLGGKFPTGYPVGQVTNITRDPNLPFAKVLIAPKARLDQSRQVLVITELGHDA